MKPNLRNNALIIVSLVVYGVVVVLVGMTIDRQFYQPAKRQVILNQYFADVPIRSSRFNELVAQYLRTLSALEAAGETPSRRPEAEQQVARAVALLQSEKRRPNSPIADISLVGRPVEDLRLAIRAFARQEIEKENSPLTRLQIIRAHEPILTVEREARPLNTWRNSLFDPSFEQEAAAQIPNPRPGTPDDELLFTYTSPPNYPPIERLTMRYWRYVLLTFFGLTVVYLGLLRYILLPIRNVARAIQESRGTHPEFIDRPRAGLERLYNRMARDAALTALRLGLHDPGSRRLRMTLTEMFESLAPRICDWFGFEHAWILDTEWRGKNQLICVRQIPSEGKRRQEAWEKVCTAFDKSLLHNLRTSVKAENARLFSGETKDGSWQVLVGVLPGSTSDQALRLLVLASEPRLLGITIWQEKTAQGVYEQVRALVEEQGSESRELMREKSEANISLSRNLGHDLTNIIATNKLDMMTLRQILKNDPETWTSTPQKIDILRESVDRLLDNTRSLQQIVNLYRAYEYLRSPRYETANINRLLKEIIEVFRLSMSAAADIACEFDDEAPLVHVEPRLMKLAVFNLLSNAQDAIRRLPESKQSDGRIVLQTLSQRDRNRVLVRLSDNGPGIRTTDGRLAGAEEIENIFDLGYTTKGGGGGEGLGLNWVRTILTEFHEGVLEARNRDEGGAEFAFTIKPADKKGGETGRNDD